MYAFLIDIRNEHSEPVVVEVGQVVFSSTPMARGKGFPQLGSHQPLTPILATNQPHYQYW